MMDTVLTWRKAIHVTVLTVTLAPTVKCKVHKTMLGL